MYIQVGENYSHPIIRANHFLVGLRMLEVLQTSLKKDKFLNLYFDKVLLVCIYKLVQPFVIKFLQVFFSLGLAAYSHLATLNAVQLTFCTVNCAGTDSILLGRYLDMEWQQDLSEFVQAIPALTTSADFCTR